MTAPADLIIAAAGIAVALDLLKPKKKKGPGQ